MDQCRNNMRKYYDQLDEYFNQIEKRITEHVCDETLKKYEAPDQPLDQDIFEFISANHVKLYKNDEDNRQCVLCMENIKEGDVIIQLPTCNHLFHFKIEETDECNNNNVSLCCLGLQHYFQYKNHCPICRCQVTK